MTSSDSQVNPETSQPLADQASQTAQAAEPVVDSVTLQIEALKKDAAAAQDRYLRSVADLENFRRRVVREKEELRLSAAARIVEDTLPVMDNLVLALQAAKQPNADMKSLVGGIDMVLQQFKSALSSHGLVELNPIGKAFNPHEQEALSHEASKDVAAEHVLRVVRLGFTLNSRLLRPAAVVVSSGPEVK
ncbi:MAG: nucleotide exchange factor GrpE [Verrucomicrobia bacterium]|nr:MAG: nucleotide exchange factor GrpE [Verrucomicrobiota bacterium]